jgi:peroxiredoxin Q/BCP
MKHERTRTRWVVMGTAIAILVSVYGALVAGVAVAAELSVGDAAPDFSLAGTDGAQHQLRDYVGKQAVVVAWFPRAFTPG